MSLRPPTNLDCWRRWKIYRKGQYFILKLFLAKTLISDWILIYNVLFTIVCVLSVTDWHCVKRLLLNTWRQRDCLFHDSTSSHPQICLTSSQKEVAQKKYNIIEYLCISTFYLNFPVNIVTFLFIYLFFLW